MSAHSKRDPKGYKEAFKPKPFSPTDKDDDESHVKDKCYTTTNEHSAVSIGFITANDSNNCPYMLRKRFRFIPKQACIVLKFSEETLFIHGRHLGKLYSDICRHKVTNIWIANYDEVEDDEYPYVKHIELKLNSEVNIDDISTQSK